MSDHTMFFGHTSEDYNYLLVYMDGIIITEDDIRGIVYVNYALEKLLK